MKGWTQAHIDRLNLKSSTSPPQKKVKRAEKQKTLPQLIDDLDDIFSIWVRRTHEEENGVIRCFTCRRPMLFKTAQNGHFITRKKMSVRWEPKNCKPQCYVCNILNEGEKAKFAIALGPETVEWLEQKKTNRMIVDRFVVGALIEEYKQKVADLKKG